MFKCSINNLCLTLGYRLKIHFSCTLYYYCFGFLAVLSLFKFGSRNALEYAVHLCAYAWIRSAHALAQIIHFGTLRTWMIKIAFKCTQSIHINILHFARLFLCVQKHFRFLLYFLEAFNVYYVTSCNLQTFTIYFKKCFLSSLLWTFWLGTIWFGT